MDFAQERHIAAGCLHVTYQESNIEHQLWSSNLFRTWRKFQRRPAESYAKTADNADQYLPRDFQESLLQTDSLRHIIPLLKELWVALEFAVSVASPNIGVVRVYLLPDDVHRRSIDRSVPGLVKARQQLLRSLDYSGGAWCGSSFSSPRAHPVPVDQELEDDTDTSLLLLFNNIPSPEPNPNLLTPSPSQESMFGLLESRVPGLVTELYPYQRESAAMMLQKEVYQDQVLDPRLRHLKDQNGSSWYLDAVAGVVLLEPRYYDGVSGGILAEQMGSGKTVICLALILATKALPSNPPEVFGAGESPRRKTVTSLADMAASCATRHGVPWKPYFGAYEREMGYEFSRCIEALERNPGYYLLPAPEPRRGGRHPSLIIEPPTKVYLSSTSIVIVPNNLVAQWRQEILKHTEGLNVLTLVKTDEIPSTAELLRYDILLLSQSRFELIERVYFMDASPLSQIHFKRCIVDEGHKLGNSKIGSKSNMLMGLNKLHVSSRWIVTGTPSVGLFGVDNQDLGVTTTNNSEGNDDNNRPEKINQSSTEMEKKDLERIGSIAALYLKARPWANTTMETGDTPASWSTYLMLPKHNRKSHGRWDCLKLTLNSLIIRHRLDEVKTLLPTVEEKIVVLDGSYQDQLSLNLFSMMIVFNSVQSQRTDMDYFFHPRQRKSLLRIVHNLKQTSFFGGSFFTAEEIAKSVQTAEEFLKKEEVKISLEDEALLKEAIQFGHLANDNTLRNLSNQFHEMPVGVREFPGGAGPNWSLDGKDGDIICTSASLLLAIQRRIYSAAGNPEELNSLLNGQLMQEGILEREKLLVKEATGKETASRDRNAETMAGNTKLGNDSPRKTRSHGFNGPMPKESISENHLSGPLQMTEITSTVSAKLSYLIDGIIEHQDDEKIIVFYENENVAWYLASMLDVLQIQHLIYAKGLSTERRSAYVDTFHDNATFRVLLMDISLAAFGLDMRAASRIYFINPVLNPQIEAQAIGRVRRISQKSHVSVETLVLRDSIDEVLLERKKHMTQAEHRRVKSILDIRPIYNWMKSAHTVSMPDIAECPAAQMKTLMTPQKVFGRGFGRTVHPDEGLILSGVEESKPRNGSPSWPTTPPLGAGVKRPHGTGLEHAALDTDVEHIHETAALVTRPARRVRFASD